MRRDQLLRGVAIVASVLAAVALAPTTASAQEESKFHVRLFGVAVSSTGEDVVQDPPTTLAAQFGSGLGYGAALEYRLSRRVGVEIGAMLARPDAEFIATEGAESRSITGDARFVPLTAGLNVHVTRGGPVDVYLGPVVGVGLIQDMQLSSPAGPVAGPDPKSHLVWGGTLGASLRLGHSGWALETMVRYLSAELEIDDPDSPFRRVGLNPIVATVGVAYHF